MHPISVCIIAYNEADKIDRCLQGVSWVDEIIVVDSGSTDKTVEICRGYAHKIEYRAWSGYVDQKNYVVSLAKNDWVLSLDADEEISPELSTEIQNLLQQDTLPVSGYKIPRLTYYLGKWIKHSGWYPDYQLRLFNKKTAKWVGKELHEHVEVNGSIDILRSPLYHYTYRDIAEHLETVNRFATLWAKEQTLIRRKSPRAIMLFIRPLIKFFECYFWKSGFLDGYQGIIIAGISSFYVFLRYSKLYELYRQQ
jgi:glycosyltransferase involved in cell wall biosynthesis